MKCSICGIGLGDTWYCLAGRMASGSVYVANAHRECIVQDGSKPILRYLDRLVMTAGWVQEKLPLGNL